MKKYVIGVDIGGTKIASGIVGANGRIESKITIPTMASEGRKRSMSQVFRSIEELLGSSEVKAGSIKGIGLCAPGPLDPAAGVVYNPPNLPGWKNVPLVELVKKRFSKRTVLENDANAAGMAEVIWGAAKGYKQVFYVTVSTGIGTAVIIDGKVYHGKNGMAGEGGHVTINFDDTADRCKCGRIGCIEALASGPHTAKRLLRKAKHDKNTKKDVKKMTGKNGNVTMIEIGEAAKKGNPSAVKAINEQASLLGIWLGSMINVLDPEIIVIGGGVSLLGRTLFSQIKKTIPKHSLNIFAGKTPVVSAKLKKDVGILGAASMLLN